MKVADPQVTQLRRQLPHTKPHRRPQHQPHQHQLHQQVLDKGAVSYVLCLVATIFVAKHHLTSSTYAHITAGTNTPFTPITEKGCAAFQTVIPIHHRFWTIRFLCWDGVCFGIGPIACFAWLLHGTDRLKRNGGFDLTTPAVSASCHEQRIRHIWTTDQNSTFKMPQEFSMDTPWNAYKKLRSNKIDLHGLLPPVPVSAKVCNSDGAAAEILPFKQSGVKDAKHADDPLLSDKLSWGRKRVYKKWDSFIPIQVGTFDIDRQQATCHTMEFVRGGLLESVKDSSGAKASSTLHSRAGPILQYIQFYEDRGLQAFPLIESVVYYYVKSCETKAATYARFFLLALSFTNFHSGLTGMLSIMRSGRIRGLTNLGEAANSRDDFIPLLPAPAANGAWSRMSLTVASGAYWLRSLLQGTLEEQGIPIGTHSLKAGLASMCAKFGMTHSQRKLLGYHAGSKEQSMLRYSRDSLAEPLSQMCEMMQAVKAQAFLLDCSRSGCFLHREPGHQVTEEEEELSESSSEGSENEEEAQPEGGEAAREKVLGKWRPLSELPAEEDVFCPSHDFEVHSHHG